MKKALKAIAGRLLPDPLFTKLSSMRSRNYQRRFFKEQGVFDTVEKMVARHGLQVLHGPFRGMQYPRESLLSRQGSNKLLGCYEQELHPALTQIIGSAGQYDLLIDVGCAEGYYAVGLALATGKPVRAFDTDPRELEFCQAMAQLNNVGDKITYSRWCDSAYLQTLSGKRCFVLVDCEGYEATLLDEPAVRGLASSDLIVELHDSPGINMAELITSRFQKSHQVQLLEMETRDAKDFPELDFLGDEAWLAVAEFRSSGQRWAVLRASSCL